MESRKTMAAETRPAATAGGYGAVAFAARLCACNTNLLVPVQRVPMGRTASIMGGRA